MVLLDGGGGVARWQLEDCAGAQPVHVVADEGLRVGAQHRQQLARDVRAFVIAHGLQWGRVGHAAADAAATETGTASDAASDSATGTASAPATGVPAGDGPPPPAKKATPQVVALASLIADYDKNQLAAEKKWGGKLVTVTGKIRNISEDILGKPYLSLENPSEAFSITSVACFLGNSADAERLANGETRTVSGTVVW